MKNIVRNKNFYLMLFLDAVLVTMAYISAYWLRFDGRIPPSQWTNVKNILPFLVPIKLSFFFLFELYRGMWRYTSLVDLKNVIKATALSSASVVLIILFAHRFQGYPRSVFIIDWILTILLVGGVRVAIRLLFGANAPSFWNLKHKKRYLAKSKRLMLIGAGDAGEKMLRELRDNPRLNFEIVGFADDDPEKMGRSIHGVPVLGMVNDLPQLCQKMDVEELLIAIPSARGREMRRIVDICEDCGCSYRTVPVIGDIIDGQIKVSRIRPVSYEDLLGREVVKLEEGRIDRCLRAKTILVTGGAGSIGSELCRKIGKYQPERIILCDKTENSLYRVEWELKQDFAYIEVHPILANVEHLLHMDRIFERFRPQVVFHAAAYKHVPMMELNPHKAVHNNVRGTQNMLELARQHQVERFVMVSTDKAVRPVNIMGATKRVAELLTQAYATGANPGRFVSVRFGNVVGSEGSVIPLFKKQIEQGGPITVTHPEMTRYFMTVSEAAQLILQAGAMAEGKEIFILDMGTPIKIVDMARDLILFSGLEPDEDIEIKFIGLRPGEKLYEELITEGEGIIKTEHEKIFMLRSNDQTEGSKLKAEREKQGEGKGKYGSGVSGSEYFEWLNAKIDELIEMANRFDEEGIKKKLKEIVPEYEPRM
jgi:FlaA1/EpsC-like NDP-sugar epimerase